MLTFSHHLPNIEHYLDMCKYSQQPPLTQRRGNFAYLAVLGLQVLLLHQRYQVRHQIQVCQLLLSLPAAPWVPELPVVLVLL